MDRSPATSLAALDPELSVLCLGARTVVDPPARDALAGLIRDGIDWERLWDLGHLHEVLPLLAESLPAAAGDAVPAAWLARATRRRHVTLHRNGVLAEQLGRVLDAFDRNGVEVMPVKGLVLADRLYGSLAARPAADLDILVRRRDFAAAQAILADLGMHQPVERDFTALMHEFHDAPWFSAAGADSVYLELHWALWTPRAHGLDPVDLWARSVRDRLLDREVSLLSPSDTLIHLAIHRTRSALRLRWICDVAELLRRESATLDWDETVIQARRAGATTALSMVLELSERYLGVAAPTDVIDALGVGRVKRALLERTCGGRALFRPARPGDVDQQPHLTLRVLEQDGTRRIARNLAWSLVRSARRILHETGVWQVRRSS